MSLRVAASRRLAISHGAAVAVRVNKFILKFNQPKYRFLTRAEKLEAAWAENIKEREQDPTNTIGRDADYYLAARKEVAASSSLKLKVAKAAAGNAAWVVYSALKVSMAAIGRAEWMRTDPGKPNAPVGGLGWMNRGSLDAMTDVGDREGNVSPCVYDPSDEDVEARAGARQHLP